VFLLRCRMLAEARKLKEDPLVAFTDSSKRVLGGEPRKLPGTSASFERVKTGSAQPRT
jgi:hypothetical protein